MSTYGQLGKEPNKTIVQGILKNSAVPGITTSAWNPRSGGTSKTVFKGSQEQIMDIARSFRSQGFEYNISGGATWTLEVTHPFDIVLDTDATDSLPLVNWELVNLPFEKDIWECKDRYFIGLLSVETKNRIDLNIKNNTKSNAAWRPEDLGQPNSTDIMSSAYVAQNLKRIGVRGKQSVVQSLKRTVIVPTYTLATANALQISSQYDFNVFRKQELVTYLNTAAGSNPLNQLPSIITQQMPTALSILPAGYTEPALIEGMSVDQWGVNTFVGYLQYPAEYSMVSNLKTQITQHWVFNQWSAGDWGLYDAYNGDPGYDPSIFIH